MLNACMHRIQYPGQFALPHLYFKTLIQKFPLPIVHYKQKFFFDIEAGNSLNIGIYYPTQPINVAHDHISLLCIFPLLEGSLECGFNYFDINCWFKENNLGCPQYSLTPEEKSLREKYKLEDWCHWICRHVKLRLAQEEVINRWQKRFDDFNRCQKDYMDNISRRNS